MPYEDPDPEDPMTLTGVALGGSPAAALEAVETFAEELARGGMDAAAIMELFQSPEHRGLHGAYHALGHARTAEIVAEWAGAYAACRARARAACATASQREEGRHGQRL